MEKKKEEKPAIPKEIQEIAKQIQSMADNTEENRARMLEWAGITPRPFPFSVEFFFEELTVTFEERYMLVKPPFETGLVIPYNSITHIDKLKVYIETFIENIELKKEDGEFFVARRQKLVVISHAIFDYKLKLSCQTNFDYMDTFVLQNRIRKMSLLYKPLDEKPLVCTYKGLAPTVCYPMFFETKDAMWLFSATGKAVFCLKNWNKTYLLRVGK